MLLNACFIHFKSNPSMPDLISDDEFEDYWYNTGEISPLGNEQTSERGSMCYSPYFGPTDQSYCPQDLCCI